MGVGDRFRGHGKALYAKKQTAGLGWSTRIGGRRLPRAEDDPDGPNAVEEHRREQAQPAPVS
jgi:hypothetical protein